MVYGSCSPGSIVRVALFVGRVQVGTSIGHEEEAHGQLVGLIEQTTRECGAAVIIHGDMQILPANLA